MNKLMIEVEYLTKKFGAVEPVRDVRFTVETGEFVTLLGPSGSGKSTLLGLIAGLETPTSRTVCLDGENIGHLTEDNLALFRRQHVGFVFQFFHLISTLSAVENIALPLYPTDISHADRSQRALALLDQVGLADRANHLPALLSGGERQRVAIARALVNHPGLIFCDEPTGNLDSTTGREILELLVRLNQKQNVTIFMVTHDADIAEMSHRSLYMKDGEVTENEIF